MTRYPDLLLWVWTGTASFILIFTFAFGGRRFGFRRIVPAVSGLAVYMAILGYLTLRFGQVMLWVFYGVGFLLIVWGVYSSYPNWAAYFGFKSRRPPKDYWQLRSSGAREP